MSETSTDSAAPGIAVIGMAGRFPGAADLERFWENLAAGLESVTLFRREELAAAGVDPALLDDPAYVPARAQLEGAERFDAGLFGYSPREAELMDPQHRLLLECAWEALEHAGYDPRRFAGLIGVYAGAGPNFYLLHNLIAHRDALPPGGQAQALIANGGDFLATRLSYKLALRGPSLTVQTACSTSLVAVHLAVQSLLNGECDLALAGGVRIAVPRPAGYLYQTDGILSSDGHCRPFDAAAQGAVDGEGVGLVVLKRLEEALADGDAIHAVVLGTAVNNDGGARVGFSAPGVDGRAAVVAMAQALAGIHPESIGFVEGHGTATALGDPIEVAALRQVFEPATARRGFCALGSVKANVGHLDAAAGVASLIKAVLALERGLIPPTPNFRQPNPKLGLEDSPFFVNAEPLPWPLGSEPRRAGVSSFGMGGTNAHVVLEEAPPVPAGSPSPHSWQLLVLSAASAPALEALTDRLALHLARHPDLDLADVAFTLQVGRQELAHRRIAVCQSVAEASEALAARDSEKVFSSVVEEGRFEPPASLESLPSLQSLGRRWLSGAPVDWAALHGGERRLRVPLPTYPFQRQRYWIGGAAIPETFEARPAAPAPRRPRPTLGTPYVPPRSEREVRLAGLFEELLGVAPVGVEDRFFEMGGHSLLGLQLLSRVKSELGAELRLEWLFQASSVAELAELVAIVEEGEPADPTLDVIPRVPRDGDLPLSFAQERLWFLDRLDPGTPTFNLNESVRLTGAVHVPTLARALAEVVRRHESLRTAFIAVQGRPVQRILPEVAVPLPVVDLSSLPEERREATAERLATQAGERPFDLTRPPLLIAELYRLAPDRHAVALVYHHIVGDGWSSSVLLGDLTETYRALTSGEAPALPALAVQYADFAAWQRRRLGEQDLAAQLAGWRETLAPPLPVLDLPMDRPRPAVQTFRGMSEILVLSQELAGALRGLATAQGATPFMALLAGFALVLSRWSGQDDLIVGSPIAGRDREELEPLIGIFLNMLPLRVDLSGEPDFRALLGRARQTALAAYSRQDVPVERILEEVQPGRDLSRSPLYQVLLNFQAFPHPAFAVPGLTVEALHLRELPSRFDLTIYAEELRSGGISLDLVFNADLFDRGRMAELLRQLESLLRQAAEAPEAPIGSYSLLTDEARALLLDPAAPLSDDWCGAVHELFHSRAARHPQQTAVSGPGERWSYGELDAASDRLAAGLQAAGVRRGDRVAVYAHRSTPLVPAVLGILKAGGAFVMLDPAYPAARLLAVLQLAQPRAWVRLEKAGAPPDELLAWGAELPQLALPAGGAEAVLAALPAGEPERVEVGPDDLAYVAFTSGSTGLPKGILGRHGPLSHFLPWQCARFGLSGADRFSLLSGLSHDPLQRDLFTPLFLGAVICVPDPDEVAPGRLASWMARERVSVAHLTPAMGQLLTEGVREGVVPSLRWVLLVGDVLTLLDVARLRRLAPAVTCVNLYGSTETQRAVGYHVVAEREIAEGERGRQILPLGRGMEDVQLLVLNRAGAQAGVGEVGEIAVRSPHLAAGYLGDEALTREKFQVNPFTGLAGDRIYRTGDLGRYLPDGEVEFAGRADQQVKIRGFRIELGEIEAQLGRQPGVSEAVVVAREAAGIGRRLVAYVVPQGAGAVAVEVLREALKARLPGYMIPSAFVLLERLPLTPNGKLDHAALPDPAREEGREGRRFEAPATPVEAGVAAIWCELLALERVGRHDNFFELGGHSLLATRVIAALHERFGVEVPLRALFERPTVAGVAAAVAELRLDSADASEVERLLANLEDLSEEEAESLLAGEPLGNLPSTG